ncbi:MULTISPECIES: LPO_1073/Vpar_1526 family protein [Bacillus]|uniref:LPO_1073/Vpar_1526 family protein n=1 Tax=Bacillus TaxID=1386 RepID=UPI000E74A590|nr:LPO_1073/Vpar_1526 family protein [Bacillus safensis]MBU8606445.1 hypothetical protein [Bacillus safensis]MBU8617968.1 hypothetical protein [Bacillus safensis]MBU8629096.1 hypothetical protein [Bacillus safensis]MCY1094189.1 hypothetical protein [Bacillus safensis]MCY1097922.1 hypothetical protein [Bacillus safensis]
MKQSGGKDSTNYQAQVINVGVTADEARNIALDLFKANFLELSQQAAEIAAYRAEKLVIDTLEKLKQENPIGIEKMKNPDMQFAMYTAQKEFARTGDENLEEVLIELLVERTKEDDRSLKQIVLDESLSVVTKLNQKQIDILSLVFIIRRTVNNLYIDSDKEIDEILDYYERIYCKFINELPTVEEVTLLEHLIYAGCGRLSIGQTKYEECFKKKYQKIFDSKNNAEIVHKINGFPLSSQIMKSWNETSLKNMDITSVGIAIGHTNLTRKVGSSYGDLDIWIVG